VPLGLLEMVQSLRRIALVSLHGAET
jgi:hypothetical protein